MQGEINCLWYPPPVPVWFLQLTQFQNCLTSILPNNGGNRRRTGGATGHSTAGSEVYLQVSGAGHWLEHAMCVQACLLPLKAKC